MSGREDSPYATDWLRVARQDWHRIHVMLADGDGEGAGLFLQQALEKYLKAFLLQHGWKLKKIHTLQSLLDDAMDVQVWEGTCWNLKTYRTSCQGLDR